MATQKTTKLKTLLRNFQPETVVLASWLEELGISRDLQHHYLKSGWLEAIGRGAYKKPGETVYWQGALHALQYQAQLDVHAGALTALSLHGLSHYVRSGQDTIYLFSSGKSTLPKWFIEYNWQHSIQHQSTSILPKGVGIVEYQEKFFPVKISSPERAILECLYLAPEQLDLMECYYIMEGLVNLQPRLVQQLLNHCRSIRVKRLFLYLADKAGHEWLKFVDTSSVELGSGNRSIAKGGVYISKYQLTIPKELTEL